MGYYDDARADGAGEGPLPSVGQLMAGQGGGGHKRLVAVAAPTRQSNGVQGGGMGKGELVDKDGANGSRAA